MPRREEQGRNEPRPWRRCARPRTPRMMLLSSGLGTRRKRLCTVRSVISTRAPPSGMKRIALGITKCPRVKVCASRPLRT